MKNLSHLQDKFQQYLMSDESYFQTCVINTEKVSIETRLNIYKNAYRLRLIDALSSNYPMLHLYLGDDDFECLALNYIDAHPSIYRSIRWYGDQLPTFLTDDLAELAKFEWIQTLAFDAADAPVLTMDEISLISPDDWANMRFITHPSLHCVDLTWNVVSIWEAISAEIIPPEPIQEETNTTWMLWRLDLINQYCPLTEIEKWAMQAIINHASFGDICEGLCEWMNEEEAVHYAASLLKGWVTMGLLSQVY